MKSFKEFKTESYSRLDEGVRSKIGGAAWNLLNKASAWTGSGWGYDIAKPQNKEGNPYVKKAIQSTITFPKATWKYGVKPALTGGYNFAKFGVNKVALPVAGAAWELTKAALLRNRLK